MTLDNATPDGKSDKKQNFMDELRGGVGREAIREAAKMMALFVEEFTAAGFSRAEGMEIIKGMMIEQMKARKKPADKDREKPLDPRTL